MNSENKSCERWFYITSGLLKDKLYSFARSYVSLVVLVPSSAFLIKSDCRFCLFFRIRVASHKQLLV